MSTEILIPSGSREEKISTRIKNLNGESERQISRLQRNHEGEFWGNVLGDLVPSCNSWLNSVANMVRNLAPPNSPLVEECNRLMASETNQTRIYHMIVLKMAGILDSLEQEWEWGFLGHMEYVYVAETFDQFLDIAQDYHKANKKIESAVLASAVLEDTIKKICKKNKIDVKSKTLDPLVDELVKRNVVTTVKAKRIKSHTAIRNHALHADWDEFDIEDVGSMIKGIRELIDQKL